MPTYDDKLHAGVQRMIDAGESEENIAAAIQAYKASMPTGTESASKPSTDPASALSKATGISAGAPETMLEQVARTRLPGGTTTLGDVGGNIKGAAKAVLRVPTIIPGLSSAVDAIRGDQPGTLDSQLEAKNNNEKLGGFVADTAMTAATLGEGGTGAAKGMMGATKATKAAEIASTGEEAIAALGKPASTAAQSVHPVIRVAQAAKDAITPTMPKTAEEMGTLIGKYGKRAVLGWFGLEALRHFGL